ncbi:MAG TPA: hypothetical protein VJ023_08200 [Pyrinomonadaceae bacterium]|nr:hypothetical protein [Pyrinomonadaceae bacterium]
MLKLSRTQSSHEELFIERYERLRSAALKLVLGDRQRAGDPYLAVDRSSSAFKDRFHLTEQHRDHSQGSNGLAVT